MNADPRDIGGEPDRWSDRLSEYLDGAMKPAESRQLEAHLAGCPVCAATLTELREVVARARTLEDAPPAEDLWPAIEARLAPRAAGRHARGEAVVDAVGWWRRRFDLGLPQLAAAAVLLVALSAGAVWLVVQGPPPGVRGPAPAGTPTDGSVAAPDRIAGARPAPPAGTAIEAASASLDGSNPRYDAAVDELEQALEEGRGRLDPRTLQVVEENLRIIDVAIEDARRAIAADPGNTWLRSHLAANMKRKVDLLRSATMLAAAQG